MLPFFIWKGMSSLDKNIIVNRLPAIIKAERIVQKIEVPGKHGFLTIDDRTYKGKIKAVEATLRNGNIDDVASWLTGEDEVIFSNEPDRKYKAVIISQIDFNKILTDRFKKFTVIFDCQPFAHLTDDEEYILLDKCITRNATAINPLNSYNPVSLTPVGNNEPIRIYEMDKTIVQSGNWDSEPVITIYGAGNTTLTINDENIIIDNVDGYVTIDSVLMDAYKDTILKNNDMAGEFPKLQAGENILDWIGQVEKIHVKCNTRFL